ncbi:type III polyketide synthase [Rudaeicoccus suwonensis]|uniref:Isopalmitoylresorcinol synthase n=1 Tax=Rudaeicoccus suwonensis TaxID=657409 RepID=A0A561E8G6_9MICO|nr:3-oxoacyl-[acyl-carrier-protein] synthase III C-terminal domain-containing protein [Rudaeicoccus suwonensis]TWE11904.1 isopalmitoylresorcinol synthase [Rudaeicoccus suwonensis]
MTIRASSQQFPHYGPTSSASRIEAVAAVTPPHRYPQARLTQLFTDLLGATDVNRAVVERIHGNAGVSFRHLALPIDAYAGLTDFGMSNDAFIDVAVDLGVRAVSEALAQAGRSPDELDLLVSSTVTGLAVPSLDARIAARMGLRADLKRIPMVGLGCVAGAAGIARVHDYLVGHPGRLACLVTVELCSLTVQRQDPTMANLVASSLFGDGAAAVLMTAADGADGDAPDAGSGIRNAIGPATSSRVAADRSSEPTDLVRGAAITVIDTRSRMYSDSERAMGWDVGATGLRVVLGVEVPDLVRANLRADVDDFLRSHALTRDDIGWWVAHPGGPKVLEAMQEALAVPRDALALTWASLDRIGNLSSASVLHVLADTLRERPPAAGSYGVLLAMGPGFCLEMVLLQSVSR